MTAGLCAALALAACKKEEQQAATDAEAGAITAQTILPDGMPPQPQTPVTPLAPPSETVPITASPTLTYNDAPVDPLCFLQTWNQDADNPVIDLAACDDPAIVRITDTGLYTPPADFRGAAYRPAEMADDDDTGVAFVEYRYLGDVGGDAAVLLRESGGGSGLFTTLYLMHRDGDKLTVVRPVAGGDRCNGGLTAADIVGEELAYDENLTPMALYALGGGPDTEASDALPDCASCCYATAHYAGDALDHVQIDDSLGNILERMIAETPDGNATAACFDRVILAHIKTGATRFSLDELNAFSREVQATCLTAATEETTTEESVPEESAPEE
jgi:hypothetical protein